MYIYNLVFDQLDDETLLLEKKIFGNSANDSGTVEDYMSNMQK